MKITCPNDIFTCPKKKKSYILYWKSYVHNTLLSCPFQATIISRSFKMLAWIRLLLAPGNCASAYVAPCSKPTIFKWLSFKWVDLKLNKTCRRCHQTYRQLTYGQKGIQCFHWCFVDKQKGANATDFIQPQPRSGSQWSILAHSERRPQTIYS